MDVKHASACAPAHSRQIIAFPKFTSGCKGASLMDLLMTLVVASLLFGIGVPSFRSYLAYSRLVSSTNLLSRSLALARSEAVKRETPVIICKSRDQQNCTTAGSWRQGWIVFEDQLPDRQHNGDEPLIFAKSELPAAVHLDYSAFRSSNFIAFRPTGITKTNGTFTLCNEQDAASARALILSKTGRIRFSRTRADGHPLSCPKKE